MLMIFVSDLQKAKHFYRDVLGFPLKSENDSRLIFISGTQDFIAFRCLENSPIENYSQKARSVFVFEVSSIEKEFSKFKTRGVNFLHNKPKENEFCFYAAFQDPFGNVHEIAELKNV